ncbi:MULTISPECIES: Dabb family protein [unclassified Lysinibacillus]|uniref:Dabb family protein n=1 Tax=unclassified Lysinibacillus TaxID=2636778 RepID=UPI0037F5F695
MIRHIVMWNHKDEFNGEQQTQNAQIVKTELESLTDKINGIISLNVITNPLASSNRQVLLNSLFESEEHLQQYQIHPDHVRVSKLVGSLMKDRTCMDFEEEL